ncbi:MAG: M14 family metallopeptidase, partial [Planctomycetota bacterium]
MPEKSRAASVLSRLAAGAGFLIATGPLLAQAPALERRYDGSKLVEVVPDGASQVRWLSTLEAAEPGLLFAGERIGPGEPAWFVASPAALVMLAELGLEADVLAEDVQELIDQERAPRPGALLRASTDPYFDDYRRPAEIDAFLDQIAGAPIAVRSVIGATHESREIDLITLTGAGDPASKPSLLLTFGCHAREWISVASGNFLLDRLVTAYGSDPRVTAALDRVNILLVPVANPDGYSYTHTNDRLWRKNRRPVMNENGADIGVDWNRNFDAGWGEGIESGLVFPQSTAYAGPSAFSELETQAIRDLVLATPDLIGHIDVHSFKQVIFTPTAGLPGGIDPLENALHRDIATDAIEGIKAVSDTIPQFENYTVDDSYLSGGMGYDWTYAVTQGGSDARTYLLELPPTSSNPGFLLPPEFIRPVGEQMVESVLRTIETIVDGAGARGTLPDASGQMFKASVTAAAGPVSGVRLVTDVGGVRSSSAMDGVDVMADTASGGYDAPLPSAACGVPVGVSVEATVNGGTVELPQGVVEGRGRARWFRDEIESDQGWSFGLPGEVVEAWGLGQSWIATFNETGVSSLKTYPISFDVGEFAGGSAELRYTIRFLEGTDADKLEVGYLDIDRGDFFPTTIDRVRPSATTLTRTIPLPTDLRRAQIVFRARNVGGGFRVALDSFEVALRTCPPAAGAADRAVPLGV